MSLEQAVENLRRTLKDRTSLQVASGRAANSRLLVVNAEAVIREFDMMKRLEFQLAYPTMLTDLDSLQPKGE